MKPERRADERGAEPSRAPTLLGALSRAASRAVEWPFFKPVVRAALAAAGLVVLGVVGRAAGAGAVAGQIPAPSGSTVLEPAPPPVRSTPTLAADTLPAPTVAPASTPPEATRAASPDDPVVLNSATEGDLRRLPGIGPKRASAILALRARLGRFRAVEDLLKVKGIGRATLKRLRPLVRLDPAPPPDGGLRPP
ncbi:MAG TPA: ComEA family DNA-binding protein [Polyangiaceae bacterium]|nr:ComEA family DNA-binding protein [Polyangiaceae bacterium]